MKAIVISGGGSLGSYGGGTIAAMNRDYDLVIGTSTGALMAPLVILKEWETLKTAYTSVTQKDIFSFNPFRENGHFSIPKIIFKLVSSAWKEVTTIGETRNLRNTIDQFLTQHHFDKIRDNKKPVYVACQQTTFSPSRVVYFNALDSLFEDFKDWMWISANPPIVGTLAYKFGNQWCDAGITELFSLQKAIELGATEVDVIIHRVKPRNTDKNNVRDVGHNVMRTYDIAKQRLEDAALLMGISEAKLRGATVNLIWMKEKLSDNSLIFNRNKMLEWWERGYESAFDPSRIDIFDFTK
jgi:NTE family protein